MGATRRYTDTSPEGILKTLRPGRNYQIANLARSCAVGKERMKVVLEDAANAGHVRRIPTPRGVCYRLVDLSPVDSELVKPAYQNLRLAETLTDYGRTLHDFAALCMTVRR